ncbi:Spc97/Spc98 family protein, partial [Toxoplasma gondii p89]
MSFSAFETARQANRERLLRRLVARLLQTYLGVSLPETEKREDQEKEARQREDRLSREDEENEEIVRRNAETAFQFAKANCAVHAFGTINPGNVTEAFAELLLSLEAQQQVGKAASLRRCLAAFLRPPYEPLLVSPRVSPLPLPESGAAKRETGAQLQTREKEEEEKRYGLLLLLLSLAQQPVSDGGEVIALQLQRDRERREARRSRLEEEKREEERAAVEELEELRREQLEAYLEDFFDSASSEDEAPRLGESSSDGVPSPAFAHRKAKLGEDCEDLTCGGATLAILPQERAESTPARQEATAQAVEREDEDVLTEAATECERLAGTFLHAAVSRPAACLRPTQIEVFEKDGSSGVDPPTYLASPAVPLAALLPPDSSLSSHPPADAGILDSLEPARGAGKALQFASPSVCFPPRMRDLPQTEKTHAFSGVVPEAWLVQHVLLALGGLDASPVFLRCVSAPGATASQVNRSSDSEFLSGSPFPLVLSPNAHLGAVEHLSPSAAASILRFFSRPASAVLLLSRFSAALSSLAFEPLCFASEAREAGFSLLDFLEKKCERPRFEDSAALQLRRLRAAVGPRVSACLEATRHGLDLLMLQWSTLLSDLQQAQTTSLHAEVGAFDAASVDPVKNGFNSLASFRSLGPLPPLGWPHPSVAPVDEADEALGRDSVDRAAQVGRPLTLLALLLQIREHLRCWVSVAAAVEKVLKSFSFFSFAGAEPTRRLLNRVRPAQPGVDAASRSVRVFASAEGAHFGLAFFIEGLARLQAAETARDGVLERLWKFLLSCAFQPVLLALDRCMRFGEVRGFPVDIQVLLRETSGDAGGDAGGDAAARAETTEAREEANGTREWSQGRRRIPRFLLDISAASQRAGEAVAAVREVERTRAALPKSKSERNETLSDGETTRDSSKDDTPEDTDEREEEDEDEDEDACLWADKLERESPSAVAGLFLKRIKDAAATQGSADALSRHSKGCPTEGVKESKKARESERRPINLSLEGSETVEGKLKMMVHRLGAWDASAAGVRTVEGEDAWASGRDSPKVWEDRVDGCSEEEPSPFQDVESLFLSLRPSSLSAMPPTVVASVCLLEVLSGTSLGQRRWRARRANAETCLSRRRMQCGLALSLTPVRASDICGVLSLPVAGRDSPSIRQSGGVQRLLEEPSSVGVGEGEREGVRAAAAGAGEEKAQDRTEDDEEREALLSFEGGVTSLFLQTRVRPALLTLASEEEATALLVLLHRTHILEAVALTRAVALLQVKSEMRPLFRLLFSPTEAPLAHVDPVQLNCVFHDLLVSPAMSSRTSGAAREVRADAACGGKNHGDDVPSSSSSLSSSLHRSLARALGPRFLGLQSREEKNDSQENPDRRDREKTLGSGESRESLRRFGERRRGSTEASHSRGESGGSLKRCADLCASFFSVGRIAAAGRALALSLTTDNPLLTPSAEASFSSRAGGRSGRSEGTNWPRARDSSLQGEEESSREEGTRGGEEQTGREEKTRDDESGRRPPVARLAFAYLTLQYASTPFPMSVHPRFAAGRLLSAEVTLMYSSIFAFLLELERSASVLCRLPSFLCAFATATETAGSRYALEDEGHHTESDEGESDSRQEINRAREASQETPEAAALRTLSTRFYQAAVKLRGELCHLLFSLQRHAAFVCEQHSTASLLRRLLSCSSFHEMERMHCQDLSLLIALLLVPVHPAALSTFCAPSSPASSAPSALSVCGSAASFQLNAAVAPHLLLLLQAPRDLQRLLEAAHAVVREEEKETSDMQHREETEGTRWRRMRGRVACVGSLASAPFARPHADDASRRRFERRTASLSSPDLDFNGVHSTQAQSDKRREANQRLAQLAVCVQSLEALHFNVQRTALCFLALVRAAVFASPTMILESSPLTSILPREGCSVSTLLLGEIAAECVLARGGDEQRESSENGVSRSIETDPLEGGSDFLGVSEEVSCGLRLLYSMLDFSNFYSNTLEAFACEQVKNRRS